MVLPPRLLESGAFGDAILAGLLITEGCGSTQACEAITIDFIGGFVFRCAAQLPQVQGQAQPVLWYHDHFRLWDHGCMGFDAMRDRSVVIQCGSSFGAKKRASR